MKKFNIDYVLISLVVATLLCIWAFCSIQLKVIPLIPTSLSEDLCNGWNTVLVNLAYSFTAGLFFFLLTVVLKNYLDRKKMKQIFKKKIHKIASPIDSVIDVFYGEAGAKVERNREHISAILNSKKFNDNVEYIEKLGHKLGANGTYKNYLSSKCQVSQNNAFEMIRLYCTYLSTDEILKLEEYTSMKIIDLSAVVSGINAFDADDPETKEKLITKFCDLYDKLDELRKIFD